MGKPLLSVAVPTKDRYKYLKHLIKLIQSYNSDEWEIVVQDNTEDNTEIVEFLKELNYPGCKYFHEKGQLPMSTNSDKAILHSSGEFICFLGDDDGICPNAIEYCKLMKERGYDVLRSAQVNYKWPDANSRRDERGGTVFYPDTTKQQAFFSSDQALADVIKRGFVNRGELPTVYHGIVSRKALDLIYQKCNTFFPGQSPDISNGVAVSLVVKSFLKVDDIITVPGASKFHGGVTLGMNKQYPQISDMVWFRPGAEELWDKRLPRIAVPSIIWAESSIETLKNMGRQDLVDTIDFETIYKHFVVYHYPIRKLAYALTKKKGISLYANVFLIKRVIVALIRMMRYKLGLNKHVNSKSANNIQECVDALMKR